MKISEKACRWAEERCRVTSVDCPFKVDTPPASDLARQPEFRQEVLKRCRRLPDGAEGLQAVLAEICSHED
jgi:hypothetical protein